MSFKETQLGLLPSNWEIATMEEALEKIIDYRGKTPKKSEVGIATLSAKSVKNGYIDYSNAYFISEEEYKRFMVRGFPEKGDILMTTEAPLGYVAKLDNDKVGIAQRLLTLRGKEKYLENNYLMYYLMSAIGQHQLLSRASGTTVTGIKQSEFRKVLISIPPIAEQQAIAKILSDLDEKIEINNKINKKLEEMAQAIFKQWFVDFEFLNEDGKPYKSSGGEMVESELGIIPEGWKIKELKEVIKFNKGKKPKIITDKEFDNSKLYLTIDVLNRNSIQYAINDKVVLANKKDILMVMDGGSSGSLYYGLDGIVGSTLSKLVINDEYINDDILYYFLKLNEFNIKGHLTGSAIPHTDKEYVNRLIMCIPNDKELLVRVTKILSDIREKVIINNEENSRLIKLRDILLPKLMSGEIRVPLGHE